MRVIVSIRRLVPVLVLSLLFPGLAAAQGTRLLRHPTVSRDLVAFEYAGDLWAVARSGGQARRLTATPCVETDPTSRRTAPGRVHRDGRRQHRRVRHAHHGRRPARLTYHPGIDAARGWTPDGRRVMFASTRMPRRHRAARTSGCGPWRSTATSKSFDCAQEAIPEPLPMPRAFTGAYSPDGRASRTRKSPPRCFREWAQKRAASGVTTAAAARTRFA